MSIRSLISKATAKKTTKSNKRGAMLIMTLLVLMFALIFCMSAIVLTTSTRDRYYDSAVIDQAHLTVTSYAEAIYQAIYVQEISDETVKALAAANATVDFSYTPIPGGLADANGVPSNTVAKFSRDPAAQPDGSWYYYIDVTTTILDQVESVRIYLKLPPPTQEVNLFSHTIELSSGGDLGQFNIGTNAGGATDNTVFVHGNANLAGNGSTQMYSDLITTGIITSGSGMTYNGDLVFLGPSSGFSATGNNGSSTINGNLYFITPDSGSEYWQLLEQSYQTGNSVFHQNGTPASSGNPAQGQLDLSGTFNFIGFYNTVLNPYSNQWLQGMVHAGNIYTNLGSDSTALFASGSPGGYNYNTIADTVNATSQRQVSGDATVMSGINGINQYLTNDLFSTAAQEEISGDDARALFGVPATPPAGSITLTPAMMTTTTWDAGSYVLNSAIPLNGTVTIDLAQGSVVLYVNTSWDLGQGRFNVINTVGSDNDFYIILADGVDFSIGRAMNHASYGGIYAGPHNLDTGVFNNSYIPHCYIFGADRNEVFLSAYSTLDAYIGLFGDEATVHLMGGSGFFGRIQAASIVSVSGGQPNLDYCQGPNAEEGGDEPIPVVTEFAVERFYYYYGATPVI